MRNQELCDLAPGGHTGLESYINAGSDLFFGHLSLSPQNQLAYSSEQVETKLKRPGGMDIGRLLSFSFTGHRQTGRAQELSQKSDEPHISVAANPIFVKYLKAKVYNMKSWKSFSLHVCPPLLFWSL